MIESNVTNKRIIGIKEMRNRDLHVRERKCHKLHHNPSQPHESPPKIHK